MIFKLKSYAFAMFVLALIGSICGCGSNGDKLSIALSSFIRSKNNHDYESTWKKSSDHFRRSNDNNEVEYERYVKSQGFHSSGISIIEKKQFANFAYVVVNVRYKSNDGVDIGSSVERWKFVKVGDDWYFDGYQTLSESDSRDPQY